MQHGSSIIQPVDPKYCRTRESPRERPFSQTGPGHRSNSAPISDAISKWASKPLADFVNCNSTSLNLTSSPTNSSFRRPVNSTFNRLNLSSLDTSNSTHMVPVQRTHLRKPAPSSQPLSSQQFVTISGGGSTSGYQSRASPAPYATD